jgi:hypothetical protein
MLELSDEPKRLVSTFLTYRNDIDIYTEDDLKDKEFYRVLFDRLLEGKVKINDITPLGSKKTVIERCENEPENGRKKIFMIDGDIMMVHGRGIPNIPNLYVLEGYCIENFVVDETSALHFIYLQCGTQSKEDISKTFNYEIWLENYASSLIDLFIHFGIIDYYGGNFKVLHVQKFYEKDNYSEDLVRQEVDRVRNEILKIISPEQYEIKYKELQSKWHQCLDNLLTIVSGKDYLIPILLQKTITYKKSKALPTVEEAKFMLVHSCKLDRLVNLKDTIMKKMVS